MLLLVTSLLIVDHDEDFLTAYAGIITKFGDQFTIELINKLPQTALFFDTVLAITAYTENYSISEMTFYLWFELEDNMDCKNELNDNEMPPATLEYGHDLFGRLLDIIMNQIRYPPGDVLQFWNNDQLEQFKNHRVECADTALYCYYNLQERALETVVGYLDREMTNHTGQTSTQNVEACIYLLKAFSETIPHEESKYLKILFSQNVVNYLSGLVEKKLDGYSQLRSTICKLFGSYGDWFAINEEYLSPAVTFLLGELQNSNTPISAATALTDLTSVCQKQLSKHCDQVLTMYFDVINKCPKEVQGKIIQSMISVVQPLKGQIATERTLFILNSILDNIQSDTTNFNGDMSDLMHHVEFLTYFGKGSRHRVIEFDIPEFSEEEKLACSRLIETIKCLHIYLRDKDFASALTVALDEMAKSDVRALQYSFPTLIQIILNWFTTFGNVDFISCASTLLKNCPKHIIPPNSEIIIHACRELSDAVCKCYHVDPDIPADYFDFLAIVKHKLIIVF